MDKQSVPSSLVTWNLALGMGGMIFEGFVISKLWNWFIASTFSAPTIGIIVGMAISMAIGLATYGGTTTTPKENHKRLWNVTIANSYVLLVGYILLQFM